MIQDPEKENQTKNKNQPPLHWITSTINLIRPRTTKEYVSGQVCLSLDEFIEPRKPTLTVGNTISLTGVLEQMKKRKWAEDQHSYDQSPHGPTAMPPLQCTRRVAMLFRIDVFSFLSKHLHFVLSQTCWSLSTNGEAVRIQEENTGVLALLSASHLPRGSSQVSADLCQ